MHVSLILNDELKCHNNVIFSLKLNKTESGIIVITFPDKKKKYTYMEDMERKEFLQENSMNFAKNFKVRDYSGKATDKIQTIGQTGKSSRFATAFVHIISNEDDYNSNQEAYLSELVGNLVQNMNARVDQRITQYESICFKVPLTPHAISMTTEPLTTLFSTEDCIQLFTFLYNKDIDAYSDTEQLFLDFPHITKEFLGSNTESNRKVLKEAHQNKEM